VMAISSFQNQVVAVLRKVIPEGVIPADQILAGPVEEPDLLPAVVFTAGNFSVEQETEMNNTPRDTDELRLHSSSHLDVWADTPEEVEEITLKALAAILIHEAEIERDSGADLVMDHLKVISRNSNFYPVRSEKIFTNGGPIRERIEYSFQTQVQVTNTEFSYGTMDLIDTAFSGPRAVRTRSIFSPILQKSVTIIRGIGPVIADHLSELGIFTVQDLMFTDPEPAKNRIPEIDQLIAKARDIRRIANELIREIADRSHPFPDPFLEKPFPEIVSLSEADIIAATGKPEASIRILMENIRELREALLIAEEFDLLDMKSFL